MILNQKFDSRYLTSYSFTNDDNFKKYEYFKKLIFHKFTNLNTAMFLDYIIPPKDDEEALSEIEGVGIRVNGVYIPFKDFNKLLKERYRDNDNADIENNVSALQTYPSYNEKDLTEFNKVFNIKYSDEQIDIGAGEDKLHIHSFTKFDTKIYDVQKKYPNELTSIRLSTAVYEPIKVQKSVSPCVVSRNEIQDDECVYFVLNDANYEIIFGGFYEFVITTTHRTFLNLIVPPSAITCTNVNCDNSNCANCQNNCGGKCYVFQINLNNCFLYASTDNTQWHRVVDFSAFGINSDNLDGTYFNFYLVKKVTFENGIDNIGAEPRIRPNTENKKYFIEPDTDIEAERYTPFGSMYREFGSSKIVREYMAFPIGWYTMCNTVPIIPIMFNQTYSGICNYFQIDYTYWDIKEAFITIDRNCEIHTHISFDTTKNDELLLGSVEIPHPDYIPSFDSTLNINGVSQNNIANIRQDKMINDNHQRIKFDEICSQTNRQGLEGYYEFGN